MNAWIKCPTCGGVLKATSGISEGPCVFCDTTLRVNVQGAIISDEPAAQRELSDETFEGRDPLPKLTRSGKSYFG